MTALTAEFLRSILRYDAETGDFVWIGKSSKFFNEQYLGQTAGSVALSGHIIIEICGRCYKAHRLAWFYVYGVWPAKFLDHKDGDPANNRLSNLREATRNQNAHNRKMGRDNTSGFKGVFWHPQTQKWRARIWCDRKGHSLGLHETAEMAHEACEEARKRLHGEFARAA